MNNYIQTIDGSNTLYSNKYNQHFHDLKTGAIKESLRKHVLPALEYHKNKTQLNILDICYGIGYNTLSTIYYIKKQNLNTKLNIYSPELDLELISSLKDFPYPKEFEELKDIIFQLSTKHYYIDDQFEIKLFIGDARKYIIDQNNIDVVYQDAFSSEVNCELWSVEYFKDIYKVCSKDSILTTYSISSNVRLSLYEAGFYIYEINPTGNRKQTIALRHKSYHEAKYIDMELKKLRNPNAKAIFDK